MDLVALATIIAGIAAVYSLVFGSKPLKDYLTGLRARRKNTLHTQTDDLPLEQNSSAQKTNSASQSLPVETSTSMDNLRKTLFNSLTAAFDNSEIKGLCFDLGIDFENLPGETKDDKAQSLIGYAERHDQLRQLIGRCAELRPTRDWPRLLINTSPVKELKLVPGVAVSHQVDEYKDKIKELVTQGEYKPAVEQGKVFRAQIDEASAQGTPGLELSIAEFDVWYSQALLYTGNITEATTHLRSIIETTTRHEADYLHDSLISKRYYLVSGRAHNHLGYLNWMNFTRYEYALTEFQIAYRQTRNGGWKDEPATALDNMGRIYADLGYRVRATLLIEQGRRLRSENADQSRTALSLDSNAIANLAFGQPNHALILSEQADRQLAEASSRSQRIAALILLTKARAIRHLNSASYLPVVSHGDSDAQSRVAKIKKAEEYLKDALDKFREAGEEIRVIQTLDELGCNYRERARLSLYAQNFEQAVRDAGLAKQHLHECINLASDSRYPTHLADAYHDLAHTLLLFKQEQESEEALAFLNKADNVVREEYRFTTVGRPKSASSECSEDFWQQLGKIQESKGHLAFRRYQNNKQKADLEVAVKYYVLAAGYFGLFSDRPLEHTNRNMYPGFSRPQLVTHRLFVEELYENLSQLRLDELKMIQRDIVETVTKDNRDLKTLAEQFFSETLGLIIQINDYAGDPTARTRAAINNRGLEIDS